MNQCDGCQAGMTLTEGLHFDGKSKFVCTAKDYHKRPYAQPNAQRRSIYTDDETWTKLLKLGNGNASAGIREAVRQTTMEKENG